MKLEVDGKERSSIESPIGLVQFGSLPLGRLQATGVSLERRIDKDGQVQVTCCRPAAKMPFSGCLILTAHSLIAIRQIDAKDAGCGCAPKRLSLSP